MPRLAADGEEEAAVGEEPGPTDHFSPEAPPPKESDCDEDLSKMICKHEAIHEALRDAPRAKSRIIPELKATAKSEMTKEDELIRILNTRPEACHNLAKSSSERSIHLVAQAKNYNIPIFRNE
ncbi:unnamed protein product [Caenorhabditis nigoni]